MVLVHIVAQASEGRKSHERRAHQYARLSTSHLFVLLIVFTAPAQGRVPAYPSDFQGPLVLRRHRPTLLTAVSCCQAVVLQQDERWHGGSFPAAQAHRSDTGGGRRQPGGRRRHPSPAPVGTPRCALLGCCML